MRQVRIPTTREIEAIYALMDEPPVSYDCGRLCDDGTGPLCCQTRNAVPSVYRWEWQYLKKRTSMWHLWRPRNDRERRDLVDCKTACDVYVECEGASRCDRSFRAFVCRTFPLEPYIENDWSMSGLVFNTDFENICPLTSRPRDLRPRFIMAAVEAWHWLIRVEHEMHEVYRDWSQALRRRNGQLDQPVMGFDLQGNWTILRPSRPGLSRRGKPRRPR